MGMVETPVCDWRLRKTARACGRPGIERMFSLTGLVYRPVLCDDCFVKLQSTLAQHGIHPARIRKSRTHYQKAYTARSGRSFTAGDVREYAIRVLGVEVPLSGRIADDLIERYRRNH